MIRRSDNIIIITIARILIPFIQLYGLYVIMHGHYSPGGGFQGGVILAASIVLFILTNGLSENNRKRYEKGLAFLSALGILIYSGIGFLCIMLSGNYLDYSALSSILHVSPAYARSYGILGVEIGVALTVMSVMVLIFINISTGGDSIDDSKGND